MKVKPQPASAPITAEAIEADDDADQAAEDGQDEGLDEELEQDVAVLGADRLADADLAGPLADRDQHDVHDPDAADERLIEATPASSTVSRL